MYINTNICEHRDFYKCFHPLLSFLLMQILEIFCILDNCIKASVSIKAPLKIKRTNLLNTHPHTTSALVPSLSSS